MKLLFKALLLLGLSHFSFGQNSTNCIQDPLNPSCASFQLPNVDEAIAKMCMMMENMAGCTVDKICADSKYSGDQYCKRFSVLKDLCEDMQMSACKDYVSLCTKGTVVQQCNTPYLSLNSASLKHLITDMCDQMSMPGCEKCSGNGINCDVLTVYSSLCMMMPTMTQCANWWSICSAVPLWPICNPSRMGPMPQMQMYFHTGYVDYVLFQEWVPRSMPQYVGTWIAVFLMAAFGLFLKVLRAKLEELWAKQVVVENDKLLFSRIICYRIQWKVEVTRAVLQFLEVGWGLLIMLIAMTFNVGLILAICFGSALATFFFSRFVKLNTAYDVQRISEDPCH